MNAHSTRRNDALVALTGVAFVVLTVVSFLIAGEPPDADAPASEVVDYWTDKDTVGMIGALIEALAALALLFFAARLSRYLARVDERRGVLSLAAFAGGIVAATGIAVDASLRFAAAELADDVDPVVTQTLNALWSSFFFPMVVGMATLILATSLAVVLTRQLLPMWMAIVGLILVVMFFTPAGFIAFLVSGLWVIVLSVMIWRDDSRSDLVDVPAPMTSTL